MIKILSFNLSGKFAHFKLPYSNSKFLKKSLFLPPISTIYGILGSIIGLNGLQQYNEGEPEYYKKLKHIPLSLLPLNLPQKFIVKYNSLNSFANNDKIGKDVNIIMAEEILFKPKYKIYLLIDDTLEEDKRLVDNILAKKTIYHIYLGKNEFFANIGNVNVYNNFKIIKTKELESIDSIFPLKLLISKDYEFLVINEFIDKILFNNLKMRVSLINIGFFIKKEEESEIEFKDPIEVYSVNNKNIYFFKNGMQ